MDFNDKIDDAISKLIVESRVPKVGIWWLIGNKVYSSEEEYRDVAPVAGYRDTDLLHIDEWNKLKISGEYVDYERGRVTYGDEEKKFTIICSEELVKNRSAIARIARHFSLPLSNLKLATDFHYTVNPDPDEMDALFDD